MAPKVYPIRTLPNKSFQPTALRAAAELHRSETYGCETLVADTFYSRLFVHPIVASSSTRAGVQENANAHEGTSPPQTNGKAIASLVFGVLNFLVLPLVGAIVAIVLAAKARKELDSDSSQSGQGLALSGLILGWVGVGVSVLVGVIVLLIGGIFSLSKWLSGG